MYNCMYPKFFFTNFLLSICAVKQLHGNNRWFFYKINGVIPAIFVEKHTPMTPFFALWQQHLN